MKVEVAVLGSPSLTVLMISVGVVFVAVVVVVSDRFYIATFNLYSFGRVVEEDSSNIMRSGPSVLNELAVTRHSRN